MPWNFVGDGRDLPITNMFDVNGDETSDPADVATIVAMLPDGKWLAAQCQPHEVVTRTLS